MESPFSNYTGPVTATKYNDQYGYQELESKSPFASEALNLLTQDGEQQDRYIPETEDTEEFVDEFTASYAEMEDELTVSELKHAIASNKQYEKLWRSDKDNIWRLFLSLGIIKDGTPRDDSSFAIAIAAWQKTIFTNKKDIDGILGPGSFARMKPRLLTLPVVPAAPVLSRWRSLIKDTIQCSAEPMVSGNETLRNIVAAIRTANAPGHYIYILGWMLDVDFCLIAGDLSTKMKYMLKEAVDKGVEVRALIWGNPTYIKTDEEARDTINGLTSTKGGIAHMVLDNNTFGSDTVKNAIVKIKSVIASLPSPVTGLLSHVGAWKDLNDTLDLVKNEGSHHEKILIVKGAEGMIGFAGGIDINPNRVDGLKGMCCGTIDPDTGLPYHPDHLCSADISIFGVKSDVLRDVSCKVRDEGAWKLLQQFIRRWESYKVNPRFGWLPDLDLYKPLRGASEPKPVNPVSPTNSNIKVLHTFNNPNNASIKEHSIRETLKIAIENAKKKVYFEDQYMISCEIADWLNARLKDPSFENVTILIQDDELASELMFTNKMRSAFLSRLYHGIPQAVLDKKVFVKMLDPNVSYPVHRRIHSKMYIIDDDLAIIGSANCSNRSMLHDSETSIVIFNDDRSKKDFVSELNTKLLTNEVANKIKYDPEATKRSTNVSIKDLDERIILGVRSFMADADWKTKLALKITNLEELPQLIIDTVKAMRPFILKVVEPYSDCGVFDVGADYELENLFSEEMISGYEYESKQRHCGCHKGKHHMPNTREMEIAEVMENQVSTVTTPAVKACETRTCWAKAILNRDLGLSLPDTDKIDDPTKNAVIAFQTKYNLPQTGRIDFVTERVLAEADALVRTSGTVQGPAAIALIAAAKTKIEDWTAKAVNNKPQYILDSFRDPRKLFAFVLHHMAFKRKGLVSKAYSDPTSYLSTGAHFCIMFDGRIIQLHPLSRMIWHAQCISPRSVSVEFEGNFPDIKGHWWVEKGSKYPNKDTPTQAQYDAGRFLASYLKIVLNAREILAHRQSSDSRENDPGPDIWYNVGQWAIDHLGYTDGGPGFKCGTGNAILPQWRTWGLQNNPAANTEYAEWEEAYEEEYEGDHDETEFDTQQEEEWNNEESLIAGLPIAPVVVSNPSIGPLGKLTINTKIRGLTKSYPEYQFTPEDALWLARFVEGEAGGQDNPDSHAVIWAMFNRFGILRHKVPSWKTFSVFLQKYSTTLQPLLNSKGAAERVWKRYKDNPKANPVVCSKDTYPGTTIRKVQYQRHIDLQHKRWEQFPAYVQSMVTRILQGKIANPGISIATHFGSTYVYLLSSRSKRGIKDKPTYAEWKTYTEEYAKSQNLIWIGEKPDLNQQKNAFFIQSYLKDVPYDAVSVVLGSGTQSGEFEFLDELDNQGDSEFFDPENYMDEWETDQELTCM